MLDNDDKKRGDIYVEKVSIKHPNIAKLSFTLKR